ncbi:hypothetical protein BLOT_006361 [Blomia tropicalis]|nr:hypothetical protein BLOT_006361 [Blomia tropicalis]
MFAHFVRILFTIVYTTVCKQLWNRASLRFSLFGVELRPPPSPSPPRFYVNSSANARIFLLHLFEDKFFLTIFGKNQKCHIRDMVNCE